MPRGERVAAGRGDEKLDIGISKRSRPLDDGLDDLIVEKGHQSQRDQRRDARAACFFKQKQQNAEDDPENAAVAQGGEKFHDRGQGVANDVRLNPIKNGKINLGHKRKDTPLIDFYIIPVKIEICKTEQKTDGSFTQYFLDFSILCFLSETGNRPII